MSDPVLSIRNLTIDYVGAKVDFHAVKNVSFDIGRGEFFGLAGESGCGKSTIAFAIPRLHRPPALIRTGSQILLDGRDVLALDDKALRDFINDALQAAYDDGTWQKIYDGTLGKSGSPGSPPALERY